MSGLVPFQSSEAITYNKMKYLKSKIVFHLENVIFTRLDVNIKVSGVTANLVCRHQRLLEVGGVVPPAKYVLPLFVARRY